MCGITGFWGEGDSGDIRAMTDSLRHRGPDDSGIYIDGHVAFGHRRLSILDIADGKQPMRDASTGITLVYNGEIYNHPDLRLELEKRGHKFRTSHSDTETLLRAFIEWGTDCFKMFNGMFACAIYNPHTREVVLARDRFGEKPLFYIQNKNGFAFASEPGALLLWPGFTANYDNGNVQRFFAWNYLPGQRSVYADCRSVRPGSWLCFNLASSQISQHCYWQFELEPDESLEDKNEPALVEELRYLLSQSVRRRLLSDVPVGVFLSGGIDSGAVLAAAAKVANPEDISTFTIGFREKSFDESAKAADVARYLHVRNNVEYLLESDLQASIPAIMSRMGEPLGDASLIPTFHLAKFARKHVKVALTGDGGDELFGGYDPLAAIRPAQIWRKIVPDWLHRLIRGVAEFVPASDRNMSLEFKIKRALRGLSWGTPMQLPVWMSGLEPNEIGSFFKAPLDAESLFADAVSLYDSYPHLSALEHALLFFTRLYLPDDILVKSDRAAMMVSLETRAVFLDNDIASFCSRLPMRFKYRNGERKYLLKRALEKWLPAHILHQPKKGFGIPLNSWLRSLPQTPVSIPGLKTGVIDYCRRLHNKRKGDYRYFLWDALAFSLFQKPMGQPLS